MHRRLLHQRPLPGRERLRRARRWPAARCPPQRQGGTGGIGPTGTGGTTTATGGAGGTSTGSVDPDAYADVELIATCDGPRTEICCGAWFSVAGPSSSIVPADSSGSFPTSEGGYSGKAVHVAGTLAADGYAQLGMNMCYASDLYDASAYDGISFWEHWPFEHLPPLHWESELQLPHCPFEHLPTLHWESE